MARTLQVDSHLHCSTHPSMPPSIISAASVLASLLLYYSAANECSADLEQMWTESLQFYSTYTLSEVSYSPYLQVQIYTGGSYIVSYFTMQVVPISQQLLVGLGHPKYTGARTKYKSRLDFVHLSSSMVPLLNARLRSQHSRLVELPHLTAKVVKVAHTTCANSK